MDNIMCMTDPDNYECERYIKVTRRMANVAQGTMHPIISSTKKPEYSKQCIIDRLNLFLHINKFNNIYLLGLIPLG